MVSICNLDTFALGVCRVWSTLLSTRCGLEYGTDAWCMAAAGICDAGRCMRLSSSCIGIATFSCLPRSLLASELRQNLNHVSTRHLSCHLPFKNDCSRWCEIQYSIYQHWLVNSVQPCVGVNRKGAIRGRGWARGHGISETCKGSSLYLNNGSQWWSWALYRWTGYE